ncbi:MSHA biogenesis protein MshI [Vibrio japonicus]|uniref:MSHA biogenesis protein MshI n=1 Tax=Vibrio japonicus TaxID=1824638 RepID=A0ABY5LFU4_9VIBR|nr:MSHA biogenesis protein MshI [Vibrio japonicus]UUM30902.1 MSHA biogenesis protein MshI [Vibrio japonicus]
MSNSSFLGKFRQNNQSTARLSIVVQPGGLYFSSLSESKLPSYVELDGLPWQKVLNNTLKDHGVSGVSADVVLHSNLYQTYQIDKPAIPTEELSAALPFLLKDLISERITDIVADAAPLPTGNKLQVFVVSREIVLSLYEQFNQLNIKLERILVEEEVWAHSAQKLTQFLLLQRSKKGQFRVFAFIDGRCTFQRTIRGIESPLTGVASSILQLDGLALELQRSIDYLSSQMKGASLHQMKVCCDEEQQGEVVSALGERLSVKVLPLNDAGRESGTLLVENTTSALTDAVNLFPSYLKPKKEYFTLKNVLLGWGVAAAALVAVYSGVMYQQNDLTKQLYLIKAQEAEFAQQSKTLKQRIASHKPSPEKIAAVSRLEIEIEAKRRSLGAIKEHDAAQQMGYSGVMQSLAKLGRNDISLSSISISTHSLDLKGLAKDPQSVPSWIGQFKNELNLVGRTFEKLKIGRNEQGILTFELKTKEERS